MTTSAAALPALERVAFRALRRALGRLRWGTVVLTGAAGTTEFGDGEPAVRVRVSDPAFFTRVMAGGSVGAGESYMDGDWDCDDLPGLLAIMLRSRDALGALDGAAALPAALLAALGHGLRRNTRRGSRRNVRAHYDLGDDFFGLFLDRRMNYSCAVYDTGRESLDQAGVAKLERLCRKLELGAGDHLLEIGCGWGGLAEFAAQRFGCRVTATTISRAQYRHAHARIERAGLRGRVEVLPHDYRLLRGRFDKLVSVEMVEAVGHQFLRGYFNRCAGLLRDGGLMALQAIVIRDSRYRAALRRADFIKKHIFPGGFIPSVSVLADAAARADLTLVNLEDFAPDYARTLAQWRRRVDAAAGRLPAGLDARFLRMWRFYLAYCEAGFRERAISDVQMLFTGAGFRGPVWRAAGAGA